jgi:hypothetical protein
MVSKPLTFGLLVGACLLAAGGGAYLATLQNARTSANPVVSSAASAVVPAPQAVAVDQPAGATNAAPVETASVKPTSDQRSVPAIEATRPAPDVQKAPAPHAVPKPASRPDTPAPAPKPAEPTSSTLPIGIGAPTPTAPADVAANAQRPWPGPPVATVPSASPAGVGADVARADADATRDNVRLLEELVVPTESVLGLQLESTLNTDQAQVEDRVDARVTRDVRVNGRAAIPAGSHVVGSVVLVERGGKIKDRARIGIRFNSLVFADGTRMGIQTDTLYRESESPANKSSAKIGGAAIGGAIIGAIIGGGKGAAIGSGLGAAGGTAAAMNSERMRVVLPAGTAVSVRTQAPIAVTVEK